MKKLIFSILFFAAVHCNAQVMQLGIGAYIFNQKGYLLQGYDPGTSAGTVYYSTEVNDQPGALGASFYYYKYLSQPSEKLSLGLQSGLSFFAYYEAPQQVTNQYGSVVGEEGGSPLVVGYLVPLYAMARFGSLATEDLDEGFGGAIGAGINVFGYNIPNETGFMIPFTLTAELNYDTYGLRFNLPLKKIESVYPSDAGNIKRLITSYFSVEFIMQL